jgi:hypothetical protein
MLQGAAEEHRAAGSGKDGVIVGHRAELTRRDAGHSRLVGDEVVRSAADEGQVARRQFDGGLAALRPEPGAAADYLVHGKLDGPGEPDPPRGHRGRPGEYATRCARPNQMFL